MKDLNELNPWLTPFLMPCKALLTALPTAETSLAQSPSAQTAFPTARASFVQSPSAQAAVATVPAVVAAFVPATVEISGEALIVSAPGVTKPQAVRFAWDDTAEPNFVGANDLPASPFRTDQYPLISEGRDF